MTENIGARWFLKTDLLIAIIIGEVCAWLLIPITKNLAEVPAEFNLKIILPLLLPLLSAIGLVCAWIFAKIWKVIYQFAKFLLVGVLNTLLDWGILNVLIFLSAESMTGGWYYSLFKSCSFIAANINSYFWNRFWVFEKKNGDGEESAGKDFLQFLAVSIIGFLLNVGAASLIVSYGGLYFDLSYKVLANLGAVAGTILALAWNFLGYKLIVFKR